MCFKLGFKFFLSRNILIPRYYRLTAWPEYEINYETANCAGSKEKFVLFESAQNLFRGGGSKTALIVKVQNIFPTAFTTGI